MKIGPKTVPTVSVMMSTFNRAQYIGEALDSLLDQDVPPVQIIVVVDGSTDSTRKVLEAYGDCIDVIYQNNTGKASALNRAAALVRAEYLWIFDDDDVALKNGLASALNVIVQSDDRPAFTFGWFLEGSSDENGRIKVLGENRCRAVDQGAIIFELLKSNFMANQAMLIRTDVFRAVGGFDERLIRCQDFDLNLKLASKYFGVRVDSPIFIRRKHDGDRGSEKDSFPVQMQEKKWYEYSKGIIPKYLEALDVRRLSAYLEFSEESGAAVRACALFRFSVLARRGLWTDSSQNLMVAMAVPERSPLSLVEKKLIWESLSERFAVEDLLVDRDSAGIIAEQIIKHPIKLAQHFLRSVRYCRKSNEFNYSQLFFLLLKSVFSMRIFSKKYDL